jgi:5,10-methylenetetrahydromethanopterin reductase
LTALAGKLRFCVSIDHNDWARGDAAAAVEKTIHVARMADEAGIDSLWLNEDPDGWDAFALLGAISRETATLRLGTGVTSPFHRNPNQMAASVATLDRLSGGRAFLGIGRGQPEIYERVFGLDAADPLAKLANAIGLLRQWWRDDGVATGFGLVEGASWRRSILPATPPPIYVAAVGPKALALAGQVADGVLFNEMATPAFVRVAVRTAREAAEASGRDAAELSFFVNPAIVVTDDPAPLLERKKNAIALIHALPGMDRLLMSENWDVPGIMGAVRTLMNTEAVLEQGGHFHELRRHGDLQSARAMIPTGLVEEATAIGSIEEVREKVAEYADAGATHCFLDRRGLPGQPEELRNLLTALTAR